MANASRFYPSMEFDKTPLVREYVGKSISEVPTPAFVVNRSVVEENCRRMESQVTALQAKFRAHVKTHKTIEGVAMQLRDSAHAIVASTLMEIRACLPLVQSGAITDILYGIPPAKSRLPDLEDARASIPNLRLMIDNPSQIDLLREFNATQGAAPWSIFIKVNMGTDRAGVVEGSSELHSLIQYAVKESSAVSIFGFYCHAGHSYASKDLDAAKKMLLAEITAANSAAQTAVSIDQTLAKRLTISVGATPTAHATKILRRDELPDLAAELEIHAGNYPFCDLQQMATNVVGPENVACRVVAEVCSCYPGRGPEVPGEVLINAGVIALAREPGPLPGWGKVASSEYPGWHVGRLSQEHGIVVPDAGASPTFPPIGTRLEIIPQHSCITANAFPWYYVVEGDGDTVVDIWTAWRGW